MRRTGPTAYLPSKRRSRRRRQGVPREPRGGDMTTDVLEAYEEGRGPRGRGSEPERVDTVVVGGGQAGLSVGHHLQRLGVPFVVLDAETRTGDVWRRRWDSLRLFTPAAYSALDGMPFPAPPHHFPSKDEFADYLEAYAVRFELPVRRGVRVDRVVRERDGFMVCAGERRFGARNVVVAMASYQRPRVPAFAKDLAPGITQLHSDEYRNP